MELGDAIHIRHGFAFKSQYFSDKGEFVVLTPGNFNEEGGFRLRPNKDRFYSGAVPPDYVLKKGDLIIAMTEQGPGLLGSSALVPQGEMYLHNQRLGLVTGIDTNTLDKWFLYYLFNTRSLRAQISGCATGTKVKHTSPKRICRVKVSVPTDVKQQFRIASVLRAYDDLIENSRGRIRLLEQAAWLLYEEWFVRFHFPGHERVTITNGVPEGWQKKRVVDVVDVLGGGTPKTTVSDYWNGDIPFFTSKDATDCIYASRTERTITQDGLRNCNSKLYPKDTVFFTARGTVGKINIAQTDMAMNQSCYALVAKEPISQHYLYFALVDSVEQLRRRAVGAVFDAVVRDTFKAVPFLVPPRELVRMFSYQLSPIFRQTDVVSRQAGMLVRGRDWLLPRLMNGEVAV